MMDVSTIIDDLNDAQRAAVTAPAHSMLVLAGAGSGKTRVLVHRIAWQIQILGISAYSILAVTFTNKAAKEMRSRIETLLGISAEGMWIGTFHGLAHRLLRLHSAQANLPPTFQVMDTDDQLRLIKRLLKEKQLAEEEYVPKQILSFINHRKDEGLRPTQLLNTDIYQRDLITLYSAYEEVCQRSGLVDFAELLLRAYELLRDDPHLLERYRCRFVQVHVDEFQDTNPIQYAWLKLLTENQDNLFVVGDDDQAIYGWRGAKIENLYNFQKDYPKHQVIRLEQNYRSTGYILNAANQLISNNHGRLGKALWTDAGDGELVSVYQALDEHDEAHFVIEKIRDWKFEGAKLSDMAILYRSNAQSRLFEERLAATGTPYRVYGGLRFFERLEVKNALAYCRLVANRHDDASFERVINTPTRGLGLKALEGLRLLAATQNLSLWDASVLLVRQNTVTLRTLNALKSFLQLINQCYLDCADLKLFEKIKLIIERSGLVALYETEKEDKGEARIENLRELVNAARFFDYRDLQETYEGLNELDMFLAHASLESGDMQADSYDDCVQLMTLHTAKGLEFKQVFIVGMEENIFPSPKSAYHPDKLEEERRLCYVGFTRARETLYLTYAEKRRVYNRRSISSPVSRFLDEIPLHCIHEIRKLTVGIHPLYGANSNKHQINLLTEHYPYKIGQKLKHPKFGAGVVLKMEGEGNQARVQVRFNSVGEKWLMLSHIKFE